MYIEKKKTNCCIIFCYLFMVCVQKMSKTHCEDVSICSHVQLITIEVHIKTDSTTCVLG